MRNVTSAMIDIALAAHLRASGTPASTSGMRSALHTVRSVSLTQAREATLGIAIKCLEQMYEKDVAGDLVTELKLLVAELRECQ